MSKCTVIIMTCMLAAAGWNPRIQSASITGRVVDETNSNPISGMDIDIYDEEWSALSYFPETDQSGNYRIDDLPPGLYYLKADPHYPQHYRQEYWRNSYYRNGASQVALEAGQTVSNVDFAMAPGGYIGGSVRSRELGQPLSDIDIQLYTSTWQSVDEGATTDDLGFFYIGGVPSGNYYVKANPIYPQPYIDQYWDHAKGTNTAEQVTLTIPTDLLDVDFDLDVGGYIIGTVIDAQTMAPISGILVEGYNSSWSKMRIQDHTDNNGQYVLGAWESGMYYVKAEVDYPDPYLPEYFSGAHDRNNAVPVTITPPNNVGGIDFQLDPGAYILGNITDSNEGLPIPDISVALFDSGWQLLEPTAKTTETGDYILGAIPSGNYYLAAPDEETSYHRTYWQNADTQQEATLISVVAPDNQYSKDFSLTPINNESLNITIEMPALIFYPGDTFFLNTIVFNRSQSMDQVPLFVILQVTDYFYFWPSWDLYHPPESISIDFERKSFQSGRQSVPIIEAFTWPVVDQPLSGIGFWSVVMDESFTVPISNLAYTEWGYSP